MIKKKNISRLFILFLAVHLLVWTLIPAISNPNLPLDTIEALAWASNLEWGFNKHPPVSALVVEVFYQIFGARDWAYYLLSQIFVIISFLYVSKLSTEFFKEKKFSLISVLLLEGIYFYNFTTPEFNVNICLLPFWSATVYYSWKSFKEDKFLYWVLFGVFAGIGFLSKYLFIYLLAGIGIFFIFFTVTNKKFNFKYLLPILFFIAVISPHIIWLFKNEYITIIYALNRTGLENPGVINHFLFPSIFILKQIAIIIPFILMIVILLKKIKINFMINDKKFLFLLSINILPIFLMFLTSAITGAYIRTMWMTPFYLFSGVLFVYLFQKQINLKKIINFSYIFLFLFFLSPSIYLYISLSKNNKRTDYPGKEIAYLVQDRWNKNFINKIDVVVGDEWSGGNLSYHLKSRPKWFNNVDNNLSKINEEAGFIYIGNPKILKEICPGVYGTIKPMGICMIGKK